MIFYDFFPYIICFPLELPSTHSMIGQIINFIDAVKKGKMSADVFKSKLDKLRSDCSSYAETLCNDAFTAAIISGNLPCVVCCERAGFDLFVQGNRFNSMSPSCVLFQHTPQNEKTIAWLYKKLDELDERALKNFCWAADFFCRKLPGCDCSECNDSSGVEENSIDFLKGIYSKDDLQEIQAYLLCKQRSGTIHKNHRSQTAEFMSETQKYMRHLNRRYNY